jgi:hypothetical protein
MFNACRICTTNKDEEYILFIPTQKRSGAKPLVVKVSDSKTAATRPATTRGAGMLNH